MNLWDWLLGRGSKIALPLQWQVDTVDQNGLTWYKASPLMGINPDYRFIMAPTWDPPSTNYGAVNFGSGPWWVWWILTPIAPGAGYTKHEKCRFSNSHNAWVCNENMFKPPPPPAPASSYAMQASSSFGVPRVTEIGIGNPDIFWASPQNPVRGGDSPSSGGIGNPDIFWLPY